MPAQDCFRLDDVQGGLPVNNETAEEDEHDAVRNDELRSFLFAPQGDDLLPQERVFGDELSARPEHVAGKAER